MGARPSSFAVEVPVLTSSDLTHVGSHVWSVQQMDVFNYFEHPAPLNKHLIVRARAGTGKTTTIIEGVNRAPESNILVCAFNKHIAQTLNNRLTNPRAEAKTLHSLGYQAIRSEWSGMKVAEGSSRADYLTNRACEQTTPKPIKRLVSLLHTKAREICPLTATPKQLLHLAYQFDCVPEEGWSDYPTEYVADKAYVAMNQAAIEAPPKHIGIDFADMVFLPLIFKLLAKDDYDLVVVDEAQDLTLAQLTIAQQVCSGRICIVGDDKQAIFGWRGADSDSLDRLKQELQATELPLTTTYRCAQSIVRRAQVLVPDIVADPSSPEGQVDAADYADLLEQARPGDFILSRLNAPLVRITLQLLRRQKRAHMRGRDIGRDIQTVLKRVGGSTLEDMQVKLDVWERKTVTKLIAYGEQNQALVDRCRDQAEMLRAIAEVSDNLSDLQNRIDWLFSDEEEASQILCSSIHKAKGLEAERVWVLQESLYRRGPSQEEDNCSYVATTRAKQHLTMVTGVPGLERR